MTDFNEHTVEKGRAVCMQDVVFARHVVDDQKREDDRSPRPRREQVTRDPALSSSRKMGPRARFGGGGGGSHVCHARASQGAHAAALCGGERAVSILESVHTD